MNTYYTINGNKVQKLETVKPLDFVQKQYPDAAESIKELTIPDGYKLKGLDLVKTEGAIKQERKAEILSRLQAIDTESVRPLRAKLSGNSTEEDDKKLADLESEAVKLRAELCK